MCLQKRPTRCSSRSARPRTQLRIRTDTFREPRYYLGANEVLHPTFRRNSMQTKRPFAMSTIMLLIAMPMAAQERGAQRGAAPAATGPAMTLIIPAFPDGGQFPVKH